MLQLQISLDLGDLLAQPVAVATFGQVKVYETNPTAGIDTNIPRHHIVVMETIEGHLLDDGQERTPDSKRRQILILRQTPTDFWL